MRLNKIKILRSLGVIVDTLSDKRSPLRVAIFYGDIPITHRSSSVGRLDGVVPSPGERQVNFVCDHEYDHSRPLSRNYENVTYTSAGYAWIGTKLHTSLSARVVRSARVILKDRLRRRGVVIQKATLVESVHPNTYGDWTSEYMKSIALCPDSPKPLVLAEDFADRAYVRNELGRLGIEYVTIDRPVLIREATVLHKQRPFILWNSDDVAAYRRLFRIVPPTPRPGSILYLSRRGVTSELTRVTRAYRSEVIEKIVSTLGGRVVYTDGMTRDDFATLASEAETVVADHGAALFNILQWKPRNLVEIVADNWWSRCFVFLGTSCGVSNHAVVRCDERSDAELSAILEGHLRAFGVVGSISESRALRLQNAISNTNPEIPENTIRQPTQS